MVDAKVALTGKMAKWSVVDRRSRRRDVVENNRLHFEGDVWVERFSNG